jgi:hydrogenase maturation protein HypF
MSTLITTRRLRVRVTGTVQGVGFRPFVYREAEALGLSGWVRNDGEGVILEAEGEAGALDRLLERLRTEAPPLALVEGVGHEDVAPRGGQGFEILASDGTGATDAPVTAEAATCDQCLGELFDPADRRHRYPFINCTNCGPRFTIVRGVPYDRRLTTMAGFEMCPLCRAEYEDPADRRFHAQPNACPACGPTVRLLSRDGEPLVAQGAPDAVAAAAAALRAGRIVAVKGLGGYHLACRADDEAAVGALRARKHREDKPFALMAAGVGAAQRLVALGREERRLFESTERPILLAPRREGAAVAESVAPGAAELGVMLPYTPLHHLLLADSGMTLVMTSGNVSDEPIAYLDDEAIERLSGIADLFLVHDRPIETRTDDSVLRTVKVAGARRVQLLRRSRGYVPRSIPMPNAGPAVLACGAELKSTFCLTRGERAWISHHIGDLRNWETLRSFRVGVEHLQQLFDVRPELVGHDLHPDYLSTAYALDREDLRPVGVQHHHAHLAACLAEHGESGPAIGAIYDGAGLGTDGTVWGGELLHGGLDGFERDGHLWTVRLPGGDRATHEPWRMACSWLVEAGVEAGVPASLRDRVDQAAWDAVARMARGGFQSPVASSMGRLFDAVAALCGLRVRINFEGQAAMELQAVADPGDGGAFPLPVTGAPGDGLTLDARETIRAVAEAIASGAGPATVSARFHNALADATARACGALAEHRGADTVVLSGGVFQNALLLERTERALRRSGLRVLVPEQVPANDGGIAYGQAAIAAHGVGGR